MTTPVLAAEGGGLLTLSLLHHFLFAGALERATRASGSQSGCYSIALLNTLESVALICPRQ